MNYIKLVGSFFALRSHEKLSPEAMEKLQQKKLRKMLRYACQNSDYYRKRFAQSGITLENIDSTPLERFPSMTKAALIANFDEIVTVPVRQDTLRQFDEQSTTNEKTLNGNYHIVHSSGSTGKPAYFLYDDATWNQMLLGIIRGALWGLGTAQIIKLLLGGPRILYIAATDGRYGGAMAVGDGINGLHAKQLFLDIKTPLNEWMKKVQEFRPNIIIGYPSAIKILAELEENSKMERSVLRVISCGEPLSENLRRYLEQSFQTTVINFYGASESLALGVESGVEGGMVLFDDLNCLEMKDGELYLTCLYNFAQPLIRYRISDTLEQLNQHYGAFSLAKILLGRQEDVLWFSDENGRKGFLHPLTVEGFCMEGLRDYQFRQCSEKSFEVLVEPASSDVQEKIQRELSAQIQTLLHESELHYVHFVIKFVEKIMPSLQTGKKQLIVKEVYTNDRV